jgi:hypothetical protein
VGLLQHSGVAHLPGSLTDCWRLDYYRHSLYTLGFWVGTISYVGSASFSPLTSFILRTNLQSAYLHQKEVILIWHSKSVKK